MCNNTIIRSKNIFISFLFVLIHSIIIKQGVINVRQYSIFAGLFFKINQKMSACTMTKWPPIAFRNEVTPLGVSEVSTILFLERRLFLRTLIEHITAAHHEACKNAQVILVFIALGYCITFSSSGQAAAVSSKAAFWSNSEAYVFLNGKKSYVSKKYSRILKIIVLTV